jgi:hypothetical protein
MSICLSYGGFVFLNLPYSMLNGITLGQRKTEEINQMVTKSYSYASIK